MQQRAMRPYPGASGRRRTLAFRLGVAIGLAGLSVVLLAVPGRSPAEPLTEPGSPLVAAEAPATAPQLAQLAPGAPAGPAARAAQGVGRTNPTIARVEAADRIPLSDPPFAYVAEPAPGGVAPKVARLRLGSFDRAEAGVQMRAGVPRGVPLAEDAVSLRGTRATRTLTVRKAGTATFSAIGVTWSGGESERVSIAVRTHVPKKDWTPWRTAGSAPAEREPDEPAPTTRRERQAAAAERREPTRVWRAGTDLIWVGAADGVEVLVTGPRGRKISDVVVDLIDPIEAPGDKAAGDKAAGDKAAGDKARTQEATPGAGRVPQPGIARRADWGADERLMTWTPQYTGPVQAVAFHHTATTNNYGPDEVPRMMRAIYYHQAVARGWGDIGYNVVVDRFGRLWEGRYGGLARPVIGAHSGGYNRETAGIASLGDHRTTPVPGAVIDAAGQYIAWKLSLGPAVDPRGTVKLTGGGSTSRYSPGTTITVPRVFPHRQTNPTECPGNRGMDALQALRDQAYKVMGAWANPATVRARLATWRPSDARWRVLGGPEPALQGAPGDVPVAADFDGDGRSDTAVWTPQTGVWRIVNSGGGTGEQHTLGVAGDRPVPADYSGDGRAEPAVWRPADGTWLIDGAAATRWGQNGDVPVPADYNGDGRTDLAVWRPSNGMWYVQGVGEYRLGEHYHIPVPADYDGDGDVEPASWSPVSYRWFVWGMPPTKFGQAGDVPIPGQYNGDGRADLAVWRAPQAGQTGTPTDATWSINQVGSFLFGQTGDAPIVLP
jgi:hypothetical protein